MDDEKIPELQKQIDELSTQLQNHYQKLIALQQELNRLQNKKASQGSRSGQTSSRNFRLENFIGLRIIHLVGIVVLVIGLSIGVKYAIDRQLISEGARIVLAYSAGIVLFVLSWRLKRKYPVFSAILFSGAMASLYFTTYGAFVYYGFFPFGIAFLLMAGFTIYTAFESMRYDRQEIAILGMVGAYAIPFLISANTGRVDLFFAYVVLINIGVVFLSFKKKWKTMSLLAMVVSWIFLIRWGFAMFEPKDFKIGVVTLGVFYFLFMVSALSHRLARFEPLSVRDIQQLAINHIALYLSALVIFGNGEFGTHLATITGWVFAFILVLSLMSYFFFSSEIILQQSMAIQSVILLFLFIGFNWNGLIVTLLWLALAVVLFIVGISSHRSWPRLAAILLTGITLGKLVIFDSSKFSTIQKVIAYIIIGALLLVLSFLYQRFRERIFEK